jgi:hypothetical protein
MGSQAIEVVQHGELQREWFSADQVLQRVRAVQKLMDAVMKDNTHYGKIPGTKKPTLYKAGSEQILAMFQIAVEPIVEDLSNEDECRIRVICRLTSIANGKYLGSGIGEASSSEQKYMWRKIVSKAEWEHYQANQPGHTRLRFFSYWENGQRQEGKEEQVRTHVPDIRNTILKMAKKRAQIDATLTVTGCSDMFEQDLEDLPEEIQGQIADQQQKAAPEPIKPTTKKPSPNVQAEPKPQAAAAQPADGEFLTENQRKMMFAIQGLVGMPDTTFKGFLEKHGVTTRSKVPKALFQDVLNFLDPEYAHHVKPDEKEF